MEFSLDSTKINIIKQGISSVNKGLIERKAALGNPKINPNPEPIVAEHMDDLIHACGDLYLLFESLQKQINHNETSIVKLQTLK